MNIEIDIIEEIDKQLHSEKEKAQLLNLIREVCEMKLNVGHNQLIRSMLKLSQFKPSNFKSIMDSSFNEDPRDIIMEAHEKFKNINYGLAKFIT